MPRKPRYDTTFRVQVTSKQDRHFIVLFLRVILFNRLNFDCKSVFFVCLSVLQVSFIPLRFRYFGRRFSFRTVDLSRECRVVPPTLRFSRKRIEIIFRGRCGPRKLNSAKNNPHVFLDKTAKIWRRENIPLYGIRFQPVKCNMMQLTRKRIKKIHGSYTLEGTDLENVESIKYLGATITSDLRWNTHVSNVCTKANRTLGFMKRNLYSYPQEVKNAAYKGLVCPVLDYGSSVWDPPGVVLQEKLESVQKSAASL